MLIYWFDPRTREFLGIGEANPDPREEGRFAIPAEATTEEPPAAADKEVAVFKDGAWSVVPDRRGEIWYRAYREPAMVELPGDPTDQGLSETEPAPPPPNVAQLIARANAAQWRKATGGYVATVAGAPLPVATTSEAMTLMGGKRQRLSEPNPPAFVNWQTGPTTLTPIAASDFIAMSIEVADFVQSTFDALPAVFAAIEAGEISSFEQIDAFFAS